MRQRGRRWLPLLGLAGALAWAPGLWAQPRPYIGFVYPAGGQQGTTLEVRLGGQGLDGVHAASVTGSGVTARVVEYLRRLNNQELRLLNEQLKELKRATAPDDTPSERIARIEKRTREFVQTPACAAIASVTVLEITIAADAEPGEREIRLVTARGVSNPLAFHIGQLPEFVRTPMLTSRLAVLGKEAQALRKRPAGEVEARIALPCVVNGQIAPGEVNRYRFEARQGQPLVFSAQARQLVPFIADAVPGWFQPVLVLRDSNGRELAYADDYRFNPDPTILYKVPEDGEYVLEIHDSIYRGREDFVYRLTIGQVPFVTSIFPLGGRAGEPATIRMRGWNLDGAELPLPAREAGPGVHWLGANRQGFRSNRVPFALGTLPEGLEQPANNSPAAAQPVTLPIVINGRIEMAGDWDVFAFAGKSNQTMVAEVHARRLDSPLDSVLKLTDAGGTVLAFNDDHEDLGSGLNTHQADSCFRVILPADGTYYVHLGDTARQGGEEYGYRLRLSEPQPDFALRVVPSSAGVRGKSTFALTVYAQRQEGYSGPIRLALKDPPKGFSSAPVTLAATQTVARLTVRSDLAATDAPVSLSIVGRATIGGKEVTREAVPAEDKMQAFLWRHLVPAGDLKVVVFDPVREPGLAGPGRARARAVVATAATVGTNLPSATNVTGGTPVTVASAASKPKFTREQVNARLRQLRRLLEEGLLTESFYQAKVAEGEAGQ